MKLAELTCSLPPNEMRQRTQFIAQELLVHAQSTTELEDGIEIQFQGEADWYSKLTEFIAFERNCCGSIQFELICLPHQGPLLLRLRGDANVKKFVAGVQND